MSEGPQEAVSGWRDYYERTQGLPARETLLEALRLFEQEADPGRERLAADLGCGSGQDTYELLRRGWRVVAVDKEAEALRRVRADTAPELAGRLQLRQATFCEVKLPPLDLANASFSLPFCAPERFNACWQHIIGSLRPGGRFAGHFFGERDDWAGTSYMSFMSRDAVRALLAPFALEFWREIDEPGKTAAGEWKQWHIFAVVARRLPVENI